MFSLLVVSVSFTGGRTPPLFLAGVHTPPSFLVPVCICHRGNHGSVSGVWCPQRLSCPNGAVFGFPPLICRQRLHVGKRIGEVSNPGPWSPPVFTFSDDADSEAEGSSDDGHEGSQSMSDKFQAHSPLSGSIIDAPRYAPVPPEPPVKRSPGRPIKPISPDHPQYKRRQSYLATKIALQTNPAFTRPPGRPRSQNPKHPVRAQRKRVARAHKKVVQIVQDAAEKVNQVRKQDVDTWETSFGDSPVNTLFACMRTVGKTAAGPKTMPGFTKTEGTREMFEQTGRGACEMIKQAVGGGVKASITQLCLKYVTALGLFAAEAGLTDKYVRRAQKTQNIAVLSTGVNWPCTKKSPLGH